MDSSRVGFCALNSKIHRKLPMGVVTFLCWQSLYTQRHGSSSGRESWILKKAELQTIDAFKLWCEKTLEGPLDCEEIQPVNPKGNQPWIFMEGLMLKLKLQYFGHLTRRADTLEKTLMLGKTNGGRRGQQRMRWLDGITDSRDVSLSKLRETERQGRLVCCSPWGCKESDTT